MALQKLCEQCSQNQSCQEVYRQLGNTKGPSVVWKAVVAFLLPIIVFILALLAFEKILASQINRKELQTTLGFLSALLVTIIFILLVKAINKKNAKNKCQIEDRRTKLC